MITAQNARYCNIFPEKFTSTRIWRRTQYSSTSRSEHLPSPMFRCEGEEKAITYTWYNPSSWNTTSEALNYNYTSEALRYGTCSQGISQFYLHTRTFIRNLNEPNYLCLHRYSWYSFADPGGTKGWVGLGGWLRSETVYLPECSQPSN